MLESKLPIVSGKEMHTFIGVELAKELSNDCIFDIINFLKFDKISNH